ncbi:hypothetical protein NJC38_27705 [Pseudomonas sp. 21LCFQ010]|uniref:XAC2610-related protein n=1 Tax=Pseudomonas sp. 21LCFQ010 TaxID=2957506 RepID=UPI0020969024|nr:hypothetical protein [Pseudomonas sp. 21LCFQ010]MCO8165920.1 hypothetical protein [Pseudomonas sp. 21LCFQ010]
MRSLLNGALLTMSLATPALAAPLSYAVTDPSGQYLVEVLFPEVPQRQGELAHALITLRDKNSLEPLQQFQTPAGNVPPNRDAWLLGPSGLVYIADFNSDGRLDVAIRNGTDTVTDKSQFDIYVQGPDKPQWTLNRALTDLARDAFTGMFSLNPADGTLHTQTDRGCCWTRMSQWRVRDGELVLLHSYTQEQVPATPFGENNSMPRGYMLRTTGDWQDGVWQETPSLEGPVHEDPELLAGTLSGKIAVEIWFQEQGSVLIGELRYIKSGNVEPIKLIGSREDYDEQSHVYLHEYANDGSRTGIWRMTRERAEPYGYTGTWVSGAVGDKRELPIRLRHEDREIDLRKLDDVSRDLRSGHYQMRRDFLDRDGDLDLKILPERDAQGREIAELTVTLKDAKSKQVIVTEHHVVPMETANLIIVREPQAPAKNGPYHLRLVKDFVVLDYNYGTDSQDMLTGMYRKQ